MSASAKFATAISRSYWLLLALCGATLVVSTGHNEAQVFDEAKVELQNLGEMSQSASAVETALSKLTKDSVAVPLAGAIAKGAAVAGWHVSNGFADKVRYINIERGPKIINFKGPGALEMVDQVLASKPYELLLPRYADPRFPSEVANALRNEGQPASAVVATNFVCESASQCSGELTLSPRVAGNSERGVLFFSPVQDVKVAVYPYQLLGYSNVEEARRGLSLPNLRAIRDTLGDKSIDESVATLSQHAKEKEGTLKVFDLAFTGVAILVALPIGILLAIVWLLMHLREAAIAEITGAALREQAVELFYIDRCNSLLVMLTLTVVPTGAIVLLTHAVSGRNTFISTFLWACALLAASLAAVVLQQRGRINAKDCESPAGVALPQVAEDTDDDAECDDFQISEQLEPQSTIEGKASAESGEPTDATLLLPPS